MNLKSALHAQRYNAALALCEKAQKLADAKGATIFYQGTPINSKPFYQISSEYGDIIIQTGENSFCSIFVADSDHDDGCYTTVAEWKNQFQKDVELWKRIK